MSSTTTARVAAAAATVRALAPAQLEAYLYEGVARVVDVREPEELDDEGLLAGAFHVPRGLLEFWADPTEASHHPALDPAIPTILYCDEGRRSALAAHTLVELGYREVAHLAGGLAAWKRAGLPVVGLRSWHPPHTALRRPMSPARAAT